MAAPWSLKVTSMKWHRRQVNSYVTSWWIPKEHLSKRDMMVVVIFSWTTLRQMTILIFLFRNLNILMCSGMAAFLTKSICSQVCFWQRWWRMILLLYIFIGMLSISIMKFTINYIGRYNYKNIIFVWPIWFVDLPIYKRLL